MPLPACPDSKLGVKRKSKKRKEQQQEASSREGHAAEAGAPIPTTTHAPPPPPGERVTPRDGGSHHHSNARSSFPRETMLSQYQRPSEGCHVSGSSPITRTRTRQLADALINLYSHTADSSHHNGLHGQASSSVGGMLAAQERMLEALNSAAVSVRTLRTCSHACCACRPSTRVCVCAHAFHVERTFLLSCALPCGPSGP